MTTAGTLRRLAMTGGLAWFAAFGAATAADPAPDTVAGDRHSITVIDGDTLQIGGRIVQLHGIDAPEPGPALPARRKDLALRARRRLRPAQDDPAVGGRHPLPLRRDRRLRRPRANPRPWPAWTAARTSRTSSSNGASPSPCRTPISPCGAPKAWPGAPGSACGRAISSLPGNGGPESGSSTQSWKARPSA